MNYEKELEKLNKEQLEAVYDRSNVCFVNANVGSGKTTVLISKVIYLHYAFGFSYRNMMVLTFTNKAAAEIKERLTELESDLSMEDTQYFGTFHKVALEMLRKNLLIESLGYEPGFQIVTPEEEGLIALKIIKAEKLKIKYKTRIIKRLEQEKISRYGDDLELLREKLKLKKIEMNVMSFDDILENATLLISKEGMHSAKFPQWIIIDEVQDCDRHQIDFLAALKREHTKIFAVGDPNQMIYSWRGSRSDIFAQIKERYNATELSLPVNYRSKTSILEVAKKFLTGDCPLKGAREEGNTVVVKEHYDSFQEANYLADKIKELHEEGLPYEEIGIFYRLQIQADVLEKVFNKEGIPYTTSSKASKEEIADELFEGDTALMSNETVKLMTLHGSKGLEFSQVFIIGVNTGLIPLPSKSFDEEAEERRLFFVGITRAKDNLELSYYKNPDMVRIVAGPSRYLRMIPDELKYVLSSEKQSVDLQSLKRQIMAERSCESAAENEVHAEKIVNHEKYGKGRVIEEDDLMIKVDFDSYGEKEFIKGLVEFM